MEVSAAVPYQHDPHRGRLRALERNILKYRGTQMLLVLFYVEELKRDILGCVRATDHMRGAIGFSKGPQRAPEGSKGAWKKALDALEGDGLLTTDERAEVDQLVGLRNTIAHELHNLVADLSSDTAAQDFVMFSSRRKRYDYDAVERLRHYHKLLDRRILEHHYAATLSFNPPIFRATERAFWDELKRLRRTIDRQFEKRGRENEALEAEMSLEGSGLTGDHYPRSVFAAYDDGRLTKRGVEICYRLFDSGKSNEATAHLMGLSLRAIRHRRRLWVALGGIDRAAVALDELPRRRFYASRDD